MIGSFPKKFVSLDTPARPACGLFGLRRAGPMAAFAGYLVRAKARLGSTLLRKSSRLPTRLIFPGDPRRRGFVPMSHVLAPASRFWNAASPASDTLTHFGSGALWAS